MKDLGATLQADLDAACAEDELRHCRELFDRFGGRSRTEMTFRDQAAGIELILERCTPHTDADGSHELMVVTRLDAALLAGLAMTAYRLRRLTHVEADIKEMVMGK